MGARFPRELRTTACRWRWCLDRAIGLVYSSPHSLSRLITFRKYIHVSTFSSVASEGLLSRICGRGRVGRASAVLRRGIHRRQRICERVAANEDNLLNSLARGHMKANYRGSETRELRFREHRNCSASTLTRDKNARNSDNQSDVCGGSGGNVFLCRVCNVYGYGALAADLACCSCILVQHVLLANFDAEIFK